MIEVRDWAAAAALAMNNVFPTGRELSPDGAQMVLRYADDPNTRRLLADFESGLLTGSLFVHTRLVRRFARELREQIGTARRRVETAQ